jgi:hypothetical protein
MAPFGSSSGHPVVPRSHFVTDCLATFASVFVGENAVLQRDTHTAIYGSSNCLPGMLLAVNVHSQQSRALASVQTDGTWRTQLPPHHAAFGIELTLSGANRGSPSAGASPQEEVMQRAVVSFGETVLCSGQSNMGVPLHGVGGGDVMDKHGKEEMQNTDRYEGKISLLYTAHSAMRKITKPRLNGTICIPPGDPGYHESCVSEPQWQRIAGHGSKRTLAPFSALCWYAGKSLFDRFEGRVPVGLMLAFQADTTIELWLPSSHASTKLAFVGGLSPSACESAGSFCPLDKGGRTKSVFFDSLVKPLVPYTLGSVLWDQGEADAQPANCGHAERYSCMQHSLIDSWRGAFDSKFAFVAVQLHGWMHSREKENAPLLRNMFRVRLGQDDLSSVANAETVSAYDLSCPRGASSHDCPEGSIHPLDKGIIAERAGEMLHLLRTTGGAPLTTQLPPRAIRAVAHKLTTSKAASDHDDGTEEMIWMEVVVHFDGGKMPLKLKPTQNCDDCCGAPSVGVGDFDVSIDMDSASYMRPDRGSHQGETRRNNSLSYLDKGDDSLVYLDTGNDTFVYLPDLNETSLDFAAKYLPDLNGFDFLGAAKHSLVYLDEAALDGTWFGVKGMPNVHPDGRSIGLRVQLPKGERPTLVRYTGSQNFPQCKIVDATGKPAYPFVLDVTR